MPEPTPTRACRAECSSLGFDLSATDQLGFDISGFSGAGYFAVGNNFYGIDLNTGAASLIGSLGLSGITGISVVPVPEPGTWAMLLLGFGFIGVALRSRRPVPVAARI